MSARPMALVKQAICDLRQEYERSGSLKTDKLTLPFTEKHGDLLRKLDDPKGCVEQVFWVLRDVAKKKNKLPLDAKIFVRGILQEVLVAGARESEAKALDRLIVKYDQYMPKLSKLHGRDLIKASDKELTALLDTSANLRELHAYGASLKRARKQAPKIDRGGTPAETLLKEGLSNLFYELTGERRDDEVAVLSSILLDKTISAKSVRAARRWRARGIVSSKEK